MFKQLNKKINQSPRRIRNFYSNLIAGIITGGIMGGLLSIIQEYSGLSWKMPLFIQILIFLGMFFLLYYLGRKSIIKTTNNLQEIKIYNSNIRAGLFAALFVTILLAFPQLKIRLYLILPLTIILVVIIYFIAGRRNKK